MNTIAELGFAQSFFAGFHAQAIEFAFGKKDDRASIEDRLLSSLDKVFGQFHNRAAQRAEAVERALESSQPLVDNAVSITAGTFKLEIATLTTDYEGNATVQSLVVEASVFRLEAETPEGSAVLDLSGASVSLTQAEIENGREINYFNRTAEISNFNLLAQTNDSFIEAQQASQTLTETRVALEAYRNGDDHDFDDDDDDDFDEDHANGLLTGAGSNFVEIQLAIQTLTETQLALQAYREGGDGSILSRLLEEA